MVTDSGSNKFYCDVQTDAFGGHFDSDQSFEMAAGASKVLTWSYLKDVLYTPTVHAMVVKIFEDDAANTGTPVATFNVVPGTLSATPTSGTVTFWATSTGASGGTPKAGTYRIFVDVQCDLGATTNQHRNSDVGFADPAFAGETADWQKGYLRSGITGYAIAFGETLGGATPNPFAWPYSGRVRITGAQQANSVDTTKAVTMKSRNAGGPIRSLDATNAKAATTTWDDNGTGFAFDTTDPTAFGLSIDTISNTGTGSTGGKSVLSNRPWTHFETAPTGWTLGSNDGGGSGNDAGKSVFISTSNTLYNWDSTCTIAAESNPDTTKKYNRGDRFPISGEITCTLKNARSEGFTSRSGDNFQVRDVGASAQDDTFVVSSAHTVGNGGATSLHVTTIAAGSRASTDTTFPVGSKPKRIRWNDTATNGPVAIGATNIGDWFSVGTILKHLQLNNATIPAPGNSFNASIRVTSRLTSDLPSYTGIITGARGQALVGHTGKFSIQDDGSLIAAKTTNTLTTNADGVALDAGGFPIDIWADKPGGGWDFFADGTASSVAFTGAGNTSTSTRGGAGTFDWTLLAQSPKYRLLVSGGPATAAADGDHWHAGDPLLVGLALADMDANQIIAVDASPAPVMLIGRFNVTLGRAEYLDSDLTWKATTGATIYDWPLTQSAGDANVWIKLFSAADTTGWGDADMIAVGKIFKSSTPYHANGFGPALSKNANPHDGDVFDPTGMFK